jgi:hypothetical protein
MEICETHGRLEHQEVRLAERLDRLLKVVRSLRDIVMSVCLSASLQEIVKRHGPTRRH